MSGKDLREGWLLGLKAGSTVIICTEYGEHIRPVRRVTPTGYIITVGLNRLDEDKFDSQGKIVGDKFHPRHLEQATEERIYRINETIFSQID